jgi:hypothetical protein
MRRLAERSLIVPSREQSIGLTRAGIPASFPAAILSAPGVAREYLTDPDNGPVVLVPSPESEQAFDRLEGLLRRIDVPYRVARR